MLLNQMEVSGPPPLSTEKIQEIPVVVITQAQVGKMFIFTFKVSVCLVTIIQVYSSLIISSLQFTHLLAGFLDLHIYS